MANKARFELNYSGVGKLLKSREMQDTLRNYANEYPGDKEIDAYVEQTRAVVEVKIKGAKK